ncbi:MarR family transcriptional regulator [Roseomonas sp. GC11]|uniref:MarR family winged helix-turn-helix transcriptional regulator n=1 Tax=Roseomonas sp. GC11 TaxID=2950546 RepID=UPI00210E4197|nr:MarR family transcriptional regulator [Roseomonas sp. GC11]MCQ4162848.1 MarR family transcriptional regulator [Roseomonas sp. GC11]
MYRLTESFPYLVNRVGVRIGEAFSRRLEARGVTLPMYRVMAALWEQGDQRLGDLAAVTSVEMSTLSRLVGAMVGKRLLSRRRPEENGRAVEINLTPQGRALVEDLMPLAIRHEALALRGFTPEEVARLKQDLGRVFANLVAYEEEIAPPPP